MERGISVFLPACVREVILCLNYSCLFFPLAACRQAQLTATRNCGKPFLYVQIHW